MGRGPLHGIKVIELPNIGPTQFAGMALGDLGAEVLRLDRATSVASGAGTMPASAYASLDRNRRSVGVDLKHPDGVATVLRALRARRRAHRGLPAGRRRAARGRPGRRARARNPRLVYGRMTGWGQDGPLAHDVGHDINYIALAGVLAHIGTAGGPPVPPINLVGDFGGGGLLLAFGILAALARARDQRRGPGGRRGDGRRRGDADERLRRPRARWASGPTTAAPTCSTAARTSTACTRRPTAQYDLDRELRAAVLRRARARCSARSASSSTRRRRWTSRTWPALKERMADAVPHPHPRRVGRVLRRPRRLLRAGPHDERGPRAPAQRRPRHVHRGRRRAAARAGAALQSHTGRGRARARRPGHRHRRRARRLGLRPRDEIAELKEQRRDQLSDQSGDRLVEALQLASARRLERERRRRTRPHRTSSARSPAPRSAPRCRRCATRGSRPSRSSRRRAPSTTP